MTILYDDNDGDLKKIICCCCSNCCCWITNTNADANDGHIDAENDVSYDDNGDKSWTISLMNNDVEGKVWTKLLRLGQIKVSVAASDNNRKSL